jgi:hypothetical protein
VALVTGLHESGFHAWRIAWLKFSKDATIEDVNSALAKRPGWEPFDRERLEDGEMVLWLKKQVDE